MDRMENGMEWNKMGMKTDADNLCNWCSIYVKLLRISVGLLCISLQRLYEQLGITVGSS